MAFPQPFWAACPSIQAVSPNNFSPHVWLEFPILLPVLSFHGGECNFFSPLMPSGSGVQQLNPFSHLSKASPASLPSCILCSAPQCLRSSLTFPHFDRVTLTLVTPDWSQLDRPDPWSLCCPWGLLESSESVSDLPYGVWGLYVPTGGCKVWVSTEGAQESQSSRGSTARAVALSLQQQRSALPAAPTPWQHGLSSAPPLWRVL